MCPQADFSLRSIGTVKSEKSAARRYPFYCPAELQIKPEFLPGLIGLHEHSHIWVVCLFDSPGDAEFPLVLTPRHFIMEDRPHGVFSLRSPNHPNPISLTLCRLLGIDGDKILVDNLDAYDGTPVLDIKPYYLPDSVFSPSLPPIQHKNPEMRLAHLSELALAHHQESCAGAALAIRTAVYLDTLGISIQDTALSLRAEGSSCYADTLQGLSRARLANPPRFTYVEAEASSCTFTLPDRQTTLKIKEDHPASCEEILSCDLSSLFLIDDHFTDA